MRCKCKKRAISMKTKLIALEWLDQCVIAKKKKASQITHGGRKEKLYNSKMTLHWDFKCLSSCCTFLKTRKLELLHHYDVICAKKDMALQAANHTSFIIKDQHTNVQFHVVG